MTSALYSEKAPAGRARTVFVDTTSFSPVRGTRRCLSSNTANCTVNDRIPLQIMPLIYRFATLLLASLAGTGASYAQETQTVAHVLDDFHLAASAADSARYFGHFSPDAVFIGTDITERWTLPEFQAYAAPHFKAGRGWTYKPRQREVFVNGDTAWFDETLYNAQFGMTRGTGVLVRIDETWKIAQYHLTLPVPNDLIYQLVEMIEVLEQ